MHHFLSVYQSGRRERPCRRKVLPDLFNRFALIPHNTAHIELQGSGRGKIYIQVGTIVITGIIIVVIIVESFQLLEQTILIEETQRDEITYLLCTSGDVEVMLRLDSHLVCQLLIPIDIGIHDRRIAQAEPFQVIGIECHLIFRHTVIALRFGIT